MSRNESQRKASFSPTQRKACLVLVGCVAAVIISFVASWILPGVLFGSAAGDYDPEAYPVDTTLSAVLTETSDAGADYINAAVFAGDDNVVALTASSSVIVPVQAHYLALNGIAQLRDTIELVRKRMNPALVIGGVIVTQYDHRRLIDREVLESLTEAFPGKVFKTTISNSVALVEAPSYGQDIFKYKPNSKPAAQYEAIVGEILKGDRNNG